MSDYQQNPLIPAILAVLRQNLEQPPGPFGIHHLLSRLGNHPCFAELDDQTELGLFKKNFLMMNALYQLQQSLWEEESIALGIETLNIQLLNPSSGTAHDSSPQAADPMRDYYLDWRHYHDTTREDVAELLRSFWRGLDGGARQDALQTLELAEGATDSEIKQRYQRLAQRHHPDRGGDPAYFMEIRAAYEMLRA